jgi:hypothetical protein
LLPAARDAWQSAIALLLVCAFGVQPVQAVDLDLAALDALDPPDRHRQLSLMLLVSTGVDRPMLDALSDAIGAGGDAWPAADGSGGEAPSFEPDRYTSPLARIVDQSSLLAGAVALFRFTLDHEVSIRERLDALEREGAVEGRAAAMAGIDADTILIRKAIGDAMATVSGGSGESEGSLANEAARYRGQTVVLRNALEYAEFKAALDAITDQAIASVGGRLDAYQRMFDEATNTEALDRQIRSAELIYLPEGQFDPRAGELTEEMLNNMVLMESQPNP